MPITPFRVKGTLPGNAPGFLREGTGERWLYTTGLMIDCHMERLVQGTMMHMPTSALARWTAPMDALRIIAQDRVLVPGPNESRESLAARDRVAMSTWQTAGLPRSILGNVAAYVLPLTPQVRTVATRYDPSANYPPLRVSTVWETYAAGADTSTASSPVPAYGTYTNTGDWDWDSHSHVSGSSGWWQGWLIIYSVAPNAWCQPATAWGTGQVYTGSGRYSTVSGGAYVATGSYTGTAQAWGAGTTYIPSASGRYSTVAGGAYVAAGKTNGLGQGFGVNVSVAYGQAFAIIVKQFKPANLWCRGILVSFDPTLFDPAQPADGIYNPGGFCGRWSAVSAGAYVTFRFANVAYSGEVL